MKETEITIKVKLDQNNIPEEIMWSAPDGGMKDQLSKSIFLSFWDSKKKETLKKLRNEETVKLSKIKRLELENSLLTDNIDKDFVDQLIRDKLRLGKKDESTYIIVNNDN